MGAKLGLALGSGGARGFSHIGVLRVLERHDIKIDYIAGSSMGAVVGALYAAGQPLDLLPLIARAVQQKYFFDFSIKKMGLIGGERIQQIFDMYTLGLPIEQFKIPTAIVATDLMNGQRVVFTEGDASMALRASVSIPGIFVPVEDGGRVLVDGGVIDRIPVSVVREMGADVIIGVDVSPIEPRGNLNNIADVIMQSIDILQYEIVSNRTIDSDIMIRPKIDKFSSRDYHLVDELIQLGEEACEEHIQAIKALLNS
ncbi:MAG: patatin-like phospholipase family protein [Bacilli bacterium]